MLDATTKQLQHAHIQNGAGFIAALDQSGGSTPKALMAYGHQADDWGDDAQMFALVHAMRARIMQSASFDRDRVLGAILFERTVRESVDGMPTAHFLWQQKGVVPFLKVDEGLDTLADGVQMMKPIQGLKDRLALANDQGVYGTKMRSVIKELNLAGIRAVVDQQFEVAADIAEAGLMPIIEPEVDIQAGLRADIEAAMVEAILDNLNALPANRQVMLKLSIPQTPGAFDVLRDHPAVLRLVALSGGFQRDDACTRLSQNPGMIASFSRALVEGLSLGQADDAFDQALRQAVQQIATASA